MADIDYYTAPAFRNTYFDAKGVPLIAGTLESFKASDHGTQKPLYTSNIIAPSYTTPPEYLNPITLDSGASVGPLYYASDENYYLELRDSVGGLITSVDNWNAPEASKPTPSGDEVDLTNFISNADFNQFLRRKYETGDIGVAVTKIAEPNWTFLRSNTNATNTLEFIDFTIGQTDVPDNPIAYVNYSCTAIGGGGENFKVIEYLYEDVRNFAGEKITIIFYAKSNTSSEIKIQFIQEFGTGGSGNVETIFDAIQLTTTWTKYIVKGTVPSISGKSIGTNVGEIKFEVSLPLNQISDVNLTHFQMNKGDVELEYAYSPTRISNGVSLGTEIPPPPYDPVYANISHRFAPLSNGNGSIIWQPPVPAGVILFWAGHGVPSGGWLLLDGSYYRRERYNDLYLANTFLYGIQYTTAGVLSNTVTVTGVKDGNVTDVTAGTSGFTVLVTQQGTGILPEIFTVTTVAASSITPGSYFKFSAMNNALVQKDFYMLIRIDNAGVDPAFPGEIGIDLRLSSSDTAVIVADKLEKAMNPLFFGLPDPRGYFIRVMDDGAGRDPDAATRVAPPGGPGGDNIGTTQADEFKSHTHNSEQIQTSPPAPAALNAGANFGNSLLASSATGGLETRSKNLYMKLIIKY